MAESSEVQALEKISTEVGESQIKIILSSQCIKAQAFLVEKLRKQSERQKEFCNFISSNNLKLQTEIKQAELEINSLIVATNTIKTGNTELKKELLLTNVKKSEIAERVSEGEKKYEALWLKSKERYESIPFVQKLLQATNKAHNLKENLNVLETQSHSLKKELKLKKDYFANLDRNRIIEFANYLVHDLPNTCKAVQEKSAAINEISKDIDRIVRDQEAFANGNSVMTSIIQKDASSNKAQCTKLEEGWMNISTNNERDPMIKMPRLQFVNSDFDALNAKLDQIKIMKVEIMNTPSLKKVNPTETITEISNKKVKDDEFSIFFNKRNSIDDIDDKKQKTNENTYSRKKLINILDDVKLDKNDTYDIVSKINLDNLKGVNMIGEDNKNVDEICEETNEKENDPIEEIDLTKASTDKTSSSILVPPTQFLDLTQDRIFSNSQQQVEVIVHMSMTEPSTGNMSQPLKNSQESINRKRVSFDLPLSIQEITDKANEDELEEIHTGDCAQPNETMDSQMDISLVSDESYTKIKDMILKKHNLDLSPQFIYAKNKILHSAVDVTETGTSKFFQPNKSTINNNDSTIGKITHNSNENKIQEPEVSEKAVEEEMDVGQVMASSPKANLMLKAERPITGLLFNHSTQGIPDSLNVSISTTGFEDGDTDFPHCIDSSLLLSPKADLAIPIGSDNIDVTDVTSQEVPNFLSGLRKTGLSFFGQSAASESKPDTSGQNQGNNFNFNFGGSEQKTRGGLFSMFR